MHDDHTYHWRTGYLHLEKVLGGCGCSDWNVCEDGPERRSCRPWSVHCFRSKSPSNFLMKFVGDHFRVLMSLEPGPNVRLATGSRNRNLSWF